MPSILSGGAYETKKIASFLARELKPQGHNRAVIIALEGELGSGKTTFVQGFARALGVKEKVRSPTFVLMRAYQLPKRKRFRHLVHTDCYRLDSPQDLVHLGFHNLAKDQDAVILIEWADRVKKLIPQNSLKIKFLHGKRPHERIIKIKEKI